MLELVQLAGLGDAPARRSFPAASASAWRWPARWSTSPKVLLLDEPLGALDLKLREQMQVELKALQRRLGITFVFVTHDQGEALSMADRVAVFNDGRIEQVGTPEEIYERPATALRRRLRRLLERAGAASSRAASPARPAPSRACGPRRSRSSAPAAPTRADLRASMAACSSVLYLGAATPLAGGARCRAGD